MAGLRLAESTVERTTEAAGPSRRDLGRGSLLGPNTLWRMQPRRERADHWLHQH